MVSKSEMQANMYAQKQEAKTEKKEEKKKSNKKKARKKKTEEKPCDGCGESLNAFGACAKCEEAKGEE